MENEKYKAKSPRHILMADVTYFEGNGNDLEEYDLIDYQPPPEFLLGILLEKKLESVSRKLDLIYDKPLFYHGTISGSLFEFRSFSMVWSFTAGDQC